MSNFDDFVKNLTGSDSNKLKQKREQIEKKAKSNYFPGNNDRVGFHVIENGKNIFRIAPAHDSKNNLFYEPKLTTILTVILPDKETGAKIEKRKSIFNSRIHGNTPKDIVDEYIRFTTHKMYKEHPDQEEARNKLKYIYGYPGNNGWVHGITFGQPNYTVYAWDQNDTLGRLDLSNFMVERIEELNIDEDSDSPVNFDSFSDPKDGHKLIIQYDRNKKTPDGKNAKYADKFKINKSSKVSPLSTEQLKDLYNQPPLTSLLRGAYKRSDFEYALQGLKLFDEKYNYGTFDDEEFIEICHEINAYYPDEKEEKKEQKPEPEKQESEETTHENISSVDFDQMSRKEMKVFMKENSVKMKVSELDDEELRDRLKEWWAENELPWDDNSEDGVLEMNKKIIEDRDSSEHVPKNPNQTYSDSLSSDDSTFNKGEWDLDKEMEDLENRVNNS